MYIIKSVNTRTYIGITVQNMTSIQFLFLLFWNKVQQSQSFFQWTKTFHWHCALETHLGPKRQRHKLQNQSRRQGHAKAFFPTPTYYLHVPNKISCFWLANDECRVQLEVIECNTKVVMETPEKSQIGTAKKKKQGWHLVCLVKPKHCWAILSVAMIKYLQLDFQVHCIEFHERIKTQIMVCKYGICITSRDI